MSSRGIQPQTRRAGRKTMGQAAPLGGFRLSLTVLCFLTAQTLFVLAVPVAGQSEDLRQWTLKSAVTPSNGILGGSIFPLAYDSARAEVVASIPRSDFELEVRGYTGGTWIWDGRTWNERQHNAGLPTGGPPGALAYDAARQNTVLFGVGASSDQTWTWDGTTWTPRQPANRPPGRSAFGMAYDAQRGKVVIFGGRSNAGADLKDTWTWDGQNWEQQVVSGPSERSDLALAYDAATKKIVLFGGQRETGSMPIYLADTWTWNGGGWSDVTPVGDNPPPALGFAAYDEANEQTLLYLRYETPGIAVPKTAHHTWAWNGTTWSEIKPVVQEPCPLVEGPEDRIGFCSTPHAPFAMTYDAARRQMVLMSTEGETGRTLTWTLDSLKSLAPEVVAPTSILTIDDVVAAEGGTGPGTLTPLTFKVTLTPPRSDNVEVDFFVSDGTASFADGDYANPTTSAPLVFLPGQTVKEIEVPVVADAVPERDEFFQVFLTENTNSVVAKSQGIGVIKDDDGGNAPPVVMISDAVQPEGSVAATDFEFKVKLTAPSGAQPVTVQYQTFNGTAESNTGDYTQKGDQVTFLPGETEKTITVSVNGDADWEYPEFFQVFILGATNAATAKSQAVGVITNDDS